MRSSARWIGAAGMMLLLSGITPSGLFGQGKSITFRANRAEVRVQFQRPLGARERGQITRMGVRFYQALGRDTYLAKVKRSALPSLQKHALLRGIEPVEAAQKMSDTIARSAVGRHAVNPDGTWSVYVRFYEDVKLPFALRVLDRAGVTVPDRSRYEYAERILVHATRTQIDTLVDNPLVRRVDEVSPPPITNNQNAAALSNVDDVRAAPLNLRGEGITLGIWDAGEVRDDHPDLTPRVTIHDAVGRHDHSTHVGGTMIGSGANNAAATGMAPSAPRLHSYDWNNPATEQADAAANLGVLIANHSWGHVIGWNDGSQTGNQGGFGQYQADASVWDQLARTSGLIIDKSAGNDRNDCDPGNPNDCDGVLGTDGQRYDTIPTFGVAKNVITVGAVDSNRNLAGFSSSGPADDFRIKPDIVADGVGMTSTWVGNGTINACIGQNYCAIGGTSMSTPVVSGAAALLVQRYRQVYGGANPSADIVKGLMINTAQDLGRAGPDYLFGYGLLDALAAVQTIGVGPVRIVTDALDQGEVHEYPIAIQAGFSGPLRVTLNWIDPPGPAKSGTDDRTPDLINNLDLEVIGPDSGVRYPFTGPGASFTDPATAAGPNNIDNVEQVSVDAPQQGFWKVRVKGTAIPSGPQNYALVANASFTLSTQPDIRVNAALDFDETCVGEKQERQVSIFNIGGADLYVNSVAVVGGGADFSVLSSPAQPFIVKPGAHVDVTVRFSPASIGLKTGTLRILSNDADEPQLDFAMTGEGGQPDSDVLIANGGNFGNVCRGAFKDLPLTVANSGSCDLTVSSVTSSSAVFKLAEVTSFPLSVGCGDSIQIPIRFEPAVLGTASGTITVNTNDPDTPVTNVSVTGNSPSGTVRVNGSPAFGDVCAGALAEKTFDVHNVGLCGLNVISAAFVPACPDFTIVNNPFPATVSPDSGVPLTVRFTPTSAGPKSCTLVITTDDPVTPAVTITVTANTPAAVVTAPASLSFLPEVIQSIGACTTAKPFPITNAGKCEAVITSIAIGGADAGDYSLRGVPASPITVPAGHVVGEGDMRTVFGPLAIDRDRLANLVVTYESDPVTHATASLSPRPLCGEGARTGARVLVTNGGAPVLSVVEKIQLQRISGNKNKPIVDTLDVAKNLTLQTVTPADPCPPFQFHREYGTLSNPVQLLPGSYRVTVNATLGGKRLSKTVAFEVTTCDFNPTIEVKF